MRTVGIISEYNPLHLGHAWHIAQAKKAAQADCAVVVMSTAFTQRGDAAILPPVERARMALAAGADAVFALPVMWAVRDAEHFALGGVTLLHALGVDAISFGAEDADLPRLLHASELLADPPPPLRQALKAHLDQGLPYPAALYRAVQAAEPEAAALLSAPNNTLALSYIAALRRLGSGMEVCPIQRESRYHDTALGQGMPSATALRGAILRGDWASARAAMPEPAWEILRAAARAGRIHRPEALDTALIYRLRTMTDPAALPDVSEGIEDRLLRAAGETSTRETLLAAAKTRRYPYARLSRLCTHALLGLTQDMLDAQPLPPAAWLLGLKSGSEALMRRLSAGSLPLIAKAADYPRTEPWWQTELRAHDLWALGAGEPSGLALRQGVARG